MVRNVVPAPTTAAQSVGSSMLMEIFCKASEVTPSACSCSTTVDSGSLREVAFSLLA